MTQRLVCLLTTMATIIVLGALVSPTMATHMTVSTQGFRAVWNRLGFEGSGFSNLECRVTIEGSFHSRTSSKIAEQLMGYVTKASIDETHCTGGSARVLKASLPWHIRYDSFTGTLPNITGIKLRLSLTEFLAQQIEPFGGIARCLYRSTAASPHKELVGREAGGAATKISSESAGIPLFDETLSSAIFFCPATVRLSGETSSLTVQGGTAKITVTLVA
jgi:hypothetical protein